jgi:hypothetical protein
MRVTNGVPLGWSLLLPVDTVNIEGSAPEDFNRILHSRMILDPTIWRDAIREMAEFMVRVLHSRMILDPTILSGLNR